MSEWPGFLGIPQQLLPLSHAPFSSFECWAAHGQEAMGERDRCAQVWTLLKGHREEPLKAHSQASFSGRSQLVPNVPEWNGTMRFYTTKGVGLCQETFPLWGSSGWGEMIKDGGRQFFSKARTWSGPRRCGLAQILLFSPLLGRSVFQWEPLLVMCTQDYF